jgi:hypothetical protein
MNSHEIESRLKAVRLRIRGAQRTRASWILATAFLAGLLLIMAADYFFAPLPDFARWALFSAWIVIFAFAAKRVLAPLFRKITLVQIARWIETRHPEMEERLSTVLELSKNDTGVSPELLEALGKAANEDITHVDPRIEVKSAQKRLPWKKPAAALAVILLLCLVIWPKEVSRLLVRAVAPFSDIGNAGAVKFTIDPGNLEVMEGDAIRIRVRFTGDDRQIGLVMKMNDGTETTQPLVRDGKDFLYTLDPARQSFTYHVVSGRARSDRFNATVWPLPRLTNPRVELSYPAYTGLLKNKAPLGQGIEAVEGTEVRLEADLNTRVQLATLEINGEPATTGPELSGGAPHHLAFTWKLAAAHTGEAVIKLKNHLGREMEALRFPIEVLPDLEPQVVVVSPTKKEIRVRPDELLRIQYEVTEDFAVKSTALEINAGGDRGESIALDLPFAVKETRPPRFDGSATASVGQLRSRFPGKDQLKLRIRAEDGRPADLGGPGVGFSEWLTIRIDRNAESLARQELRAEHDEAREKLEKAIQEARQAKDQIDGLREEVKKEQMQENAVKRLEQTTEKLASAEEKIAELAKEMELGVHAAKADEVAKAAEQLERSKESLENAPLQDQAQERGEQLEEAKKDAEAAIKQLEEVRNAIDRDREKVEDLARVQELAQQQQELARQALENLGQPVSQQNQQQWKNEQQQVAEQLRQQLRERPDAKAEALKRQAGEAKAMAEEAREIAEAQQNLQQQAEQSAQPDQNALKEQLQQALAKEQAKIADEVKNEMAQARQDRNEAADVLPEATSAAEAALEQLQDNQPQAAAESAKKAAEAMKEAGGQETAEANQPPDSAQNGTPDAPKPEAGAAENPPAENPAASSEANMEGQAPASPEAQAAEAAQAEALGDLAERQEQVAEAMEALAKGDLNAALQSLQDAQAEAAANVAEAINETPLVDGNGNMNEAANNARQGAQQAQSAEQQGEAGQQQQAAQQHAQAAQNFQKSAEALERAAMEFSQQAEQLASQSPNPNKAELPAGELAEAFQEAGDAANGEGAEAAQSAAEAAAALAQAAQAARGRMQGKPQPGQGGLAQMPGPNGLPGEKAPENMENPQQRSPDPGVPPELAKLGITAADWEKIKANLAGDIGSGGAEAVPEEYRGLVKGYFESMSKKKD